MDNKTIGRNISRFRDMKGKKAFDVAESIGLKEAAYTKYERGETNITVDFLQKVADVLELDPMLFLTSSPTHILENIHNSPIAIQENSTFNTHNEQQTQLMLKLIDSVVVLTEKVTKLMDRK